MHHFSSKLYKFVGYLITKTMKISKIEIKDFHQFKDFTLDLTYPQGHEKEGKPLDKVCFIGQSGTGKTTVLMKSLTINMSMFCLI